MSASKMRMPDRFASLFLPISAVLMEVFSAYPWFVWAGKWETLNWLRPPLSIFSIIVLVGGSFIATRFFTSRPWPSRLIQLAIAGTGLIVVFFSIRVEYNYGISFLSPQWFARMGRIILESFYNLSSIVLALPAAAFLWWRGMRMGRRQDYNYVSSNVIFGAASFVILGIVWWASIGSTSLASMIASIGPYIAGFLFFGLTGIAFSNLRNVRFRMPKDETQQMSYGRWIPVITSLVVAIIALGGIIASASSFDVASGIKKLFSSFSGYFQTLIYWLLYPLKYILIVFEWLGRTIMEWLIKILKIQPQSTGEEGAGEQMPEIIPGVTPENFLTILKWALFIIAVIIVTIVIMRTIEGNRHRRTETTRNFQETRESLWRWSALFSGLWRFLKSLFLRFLPKKMLPAGATVGHQTARQAEQSATTLKIREMFKHLLRDASRAGIGRQVSETPLEYARRFNQKTADVSKEMNELTELYVEVRYSEAAVGDERITYANSLWRRIKEHLELLRSERI
jgi:hypothetical protein